MGLCDIVGHKWVSVSMYMCVRRLSARGWLRTVSDDCCPSMACIVILKPNIISMMLYVMPPVQTGA
jgi:hypothetical protein